MPSFHDDISPRDLSEAPRLEKESRSRGLLIGIAAGALLFVALLIFGSQPDLSPEEIVSMDGYGGEQPTRHIFNLQSFEESEANARAASGKAVAATAESMQKASMPESGNNESGDSASGNTVDDLKDDQTNVARAEAPALPETQIIESTPERTVESTESQVSKVVETELETRVQVPDKVPENVPEKAEPVEPVVNASEIAATKTVEPAIVQPVEQARPAQNTTPANTAQASIFDDIPEQRVVASMATTPRLEEQPDTVVVSTAVVDELTPMPIGSAASISDSTPFGSNGVLLPLRSVLNDSTELKDDPDENSETLMLLGKGVVVTALERRGKWILIGTNDASSMTGYVLESGLAKVDSQ